MEQPYIPEQVKREMWQFLLKRSVPELLKEKIREREQIEGREVTCNGKGF